MSLELLNVAVADLPTNAYELPPEGTYIGLLSATTEKVQNVEKVCFNFKIIEVEELNNPEDEAKVKAGKSIRIYLDPAHKTQFGILGSYIQQLSADMEAAGLVEAGATALEVLRAISNVPVKFAHTVRKYTKSDGSGEGEVSAVQPKSVSVHLAM